jgi:hypothetical protein
LINQAAPATHAVTLLSRYRDDLAKVNLLRPPAKSNCSAGDSSQDCKELTRPLILSISSESDLATRAVLPVAETVDPPKGRPKTLPPDVTLPPGLDIKKVHTTTAAFTPQLHSHLLTKCEGGDCTPCRNAWNHTPYWIFTIPTEIVPDHGTIFTDRFTDFLMAFLPPLYSFSPTEPPMPAQKMHAVQPAQKP